MPLLFSRSLLFTGLLLFTLWLLFTRFCLFTWSIILFIGLFHFTWLIILVGLFLIRLFIFTRPLITTMLPTRSICVVTSLLYFHFSAVPVKNVRMNVISIPVQLISLSLLYRCKLTKTALGPPTHLHSLSHITGGLNHSHNPRASHIPYNPRVCSYLQLDNT